MWWYLESNFTAEDALNNPFGPGQPANPDQAGDATGGLPIKCPPFKPLTDEEVKLENVDTQEEKDFGEQKMQERKGMGNVEQDRGARANSFTQQFSQATWLL
jgi:Ino eighty subunit 1